MTANPDTWTQIRITRAQKAALVRWAMLLARTEGGRPLSATAALQRLLDRFIATQETCDR